MAVQLPRKVSREVINSQSRKIIYSVLQFCKEEKKRGLLIPLNKTIIRTAEAVGKSEKTVHNIARECERALEQGTRIKTPGKRRPHSKKYEIGEFGRCLVRRTYLEFVEDKGEIPTVLKLLSAVKEKISYQGTKDAFWRLLKEMGFMFKKWKNIRPLLMERSDIVAQRAAYLRAIRINENGPKKPVVYTGETCIHSPYIVAKSAQKDKASRTPRTKGMGQKVIVIHAGGEMGFIKGAELLRCPKSNTQDYSDEVNTANYMKWLQKQLIPILPAGCIVVLHNASYNKTQECRAPSLVTKKSDVVSWLRRNNITVDETLTKRELLEIVRAHRPKPIYTVDRILQQHGFSVLRLPPYHWDLSPLENVWSLVKQKLAAQNSNSSSSVELKELKLAAQNSNSSSSVELKELVQSCINEVTEEDWRKESAHVRRIQEDYWHRDALVEEEIEKHTTYANICCSDENDSEDGDDESMEEDSSFADISEGSETESADESTDEVIVGYPPCEQF